MGLHKKVLNLNDASQLNMLIENVIPIVAKHINGITKYLAKRTGIITRITSIRDIIINNLLVCEKLNIK